MKLESFLRSDYDQGSRFEADRFCSLSHFPRGKVREGDRERLTGIEPEIELKLKLSLYNLVKFAILGKIVPVS